MNAKTQPGAIPALLPCPFCGGRAEIWKAHPENPKRKAWIACMDRCAVMTKEFDTTGEAVDAWNARANRSALRAQPDVRKLAKEAWGAAYRAFFKEGPESNPIDAIATVLLADRASHPDQPEGPGVEADINAAIAFIEKRRDDYVSEFGSYDFETGQHELPGTGDETVGEWEEIIEGLQALRATPSSDCIRQETAEERIREDERARITTREQRRVVTWLHDRANAMNDPHARAILNVAADELGRLSAADRAAKRTEATDER